MLTKVFSSAEQNFLYRKRPRGSAAQEDSMGAARVKKENRTYPAQTTKVEPLIWKLSFGNPGGFLGVLIVPDITLVGGEDKRIRFSHAVSLSRELEANPGGEILGVLATGVPDQFLGRLLTYDEATEACKNAIPAVYTKFMFSQKDNEKCLVDYKNGGFPKPKLFDTIITRLKNLAQTAEATK
jgi:hypothetical protein